MLEIAICEDEQADRDSLIGILKPLLDKYEEEYRITNVIFANLYLIYALKVEDEKNSMEFQIAMMKQQESIQSRLGAS